MLSSRICPPFTPAQAAGTRTFSGIKDRHNKVKLPLPRGLLAIPEGSWEERSGGKRFQNLRAQIAFASLHGLEKRAKRRGKTSLGDRLLAGARPTWNFTAVVVGRLSDQSFL